MILNGIKANFLGDSITEGCGTTDKKSKVFHALIAARNNMTARDYGISGTRFAKQHVPTEGKPNHDRDFCQRVEQMEKDSHIDSSKIYNTVMRIVEYIEKNYMNDIGSQDIEREFFINFDYANRIFKKIMNCNIIKYRNLLRINVAKNIMRISDNTLDEVSEEIGFQDKCYFIRIFKKYEGITPGKYREQLMRDNRIEEGD